MAGLYRKSRRYRDYQPGKKKRIVIKKIVLYLILLCIITNIIFRFFLVTYRTGSESMAPLLPVDSVFMATPLIFGNAIPVAGIRIPGFRKPERGDVVVIVPAYLEEDSVYRKALDGIVRFFTLQKVTINSSAKKEWENNVIVKRVIGLPGDEIKAEAYRIMIRPAGGAAFISEGDLLGEETAITYPDFPENWDSEHPFSGNIDPIVIEEGKYLLLSDNRGRGSDGFIWGLSDLGDIKQKVLLRYWPSVKFRM